jgi:hypothetical protein
VQRPPANRPGTGLEAHSDPLLAVAARRLTALPFDSLAAFIAELERLKTLAWKRLVREASPAPEAQAAPIEELRHVSPAAVAELLSLKEPYIHELCRTGKLPSTKKGKYWIIPVAGLREWLAYRKRDVDRSVQAARNSPDHPTAPAPFLRLRRPAGRP